MKYPYDDLYMRYDEVNNMYVLTEEALLQAGIDLRGRLVERKYNSPDSIINEVLFLASNRIYAYIHEHAYDSDGVDRVIALCPSARPIIMNALKQQVIYLLTVGDLALSTNKEERALVISDLAKAILKSKIVKETGATLLYGGIV